MATIEREEFYLAINMLKELIQGTHESVKGTNGRLDTLNGRTRRIEVKVAIQWVLWCLFGSVLAILGTAVTRLWIK